MKKLFQTDDGNAVVKQIDIDNTAKLLTVLNKAQTARSVTPNTIMQWRKTLAACRVHNADFQTIFEWVISNYTKNEYLQTCFRSATAIKTHFRELRLEYTKYSRKTLLIPETATINEELLDKTTEEVIKSLPGWGATYAHVRYAVWEYLEVCADVEELLFETQRNAHNKSQVVAEICVPAILKGMQEHYLSFYVEHITELLEWKQWYGEIAGTKLNINRQNPQRIKGLLNHNIKKMEGLESSTYTAVCDGIVKRLIAEAQYASR